MENITPEEEETMDVILYLIPDDLPRAVVRDLHILIQEIDGCKNFWDAKAFIEIEFESKIKADAARTNGFVYVFNGQEYKQKYAPKARVLSFLAANLPPNIGEGR